MGAATAHRQCRRSAWTSAAAASIPRRLASSSTRSKESSPSCLYLDASGGELIRRYDETRRRHPLAPDRPAEDGIAQERALTWPLRTCGRQPHRHHRLLPAELRDELQAALRRRLRPACPHDLVLFAFARGISRTADLVFDLRFLPNPHWVDEFAAADGRGPGGSFLSGTGPAWAEAMARIESLLIDWIPRYWAAGKSYVTVAFGCTGGRHRSVAAAVEMAERLSRAGFAPNVRHRDLASPPSDTIERHPGRAPGSEVS